MEKNSILSDFIVLNRQRIDELEANLWHMEHKKSGFWLARGSVCILGSRQQVDACAGWLDNIMVL